MLVWKYFDWPLIFNIHMLTEYMISTCWRSTWYPHVDGVHDIHMLTEHMISTCWQSTWYPHVDGAHDIHMLTEHMISTCWRSTCYPHVDGAPDMHMLTEHMSSPPVFSAVRVTRSLVLCVCFVDSCLSFCSFCLWPLCCSSSIYRFWLPFWYLQTLSDSTLISKEMLLVNTSGQSRL